MFKLNQKPGFRRHLFTMSVIFLAALMSACVEHSHGWDDRDRNVDNTNFSASESFYFEISPANQQVFTLDAINGTVDLIGVPGSNSVIVTGLRRVRSESVSDAEQYLQDLQVLVSSSGSEVYVETEQPDETFGRGYDVFYQIEVPDHWRVNIDHVNGNVVLDSLFGTASVNAVNGDLLVREINGSLDADLVNGRITATAIVPVDGYCRLETVNGLIDLSVPVNTSAMVNLDVVNGTMQINNLQLQQTNTSNQSISGRLGDGRGSIDLETVNGNIFLTGF